jgi:hypothetical protein
VKCYACSAEATTREHVPPKSFFPKDRRQELLTVPSCYAHNHDQSLDIEYVRNLISCTYGTNAEAEQTFDIAKRSFDRSSALFHRTFSDLEQIHFNGEETGTFSVDLERVKSVMRPIANALYFIDSGEPCRSVWKVFVTSLRSQANIDGLPSQWTELRGLLSSIQFLAKPVPQPDIFTYAMGKITGGVVYELVFYGSFVTHCFGRTAGRPLTT